jgi:threonine dehydrogenase-like Zn-dependent dehydrogenase
LRALWLEGGRARLVELPRPEPGPGQAVVRPVVVGLCATDLELARGYQGFAGVPGHEVVGVVESSPERPELEGRRVAVEINFGCGACPACAAGDPRHCPGRRALGIRGAPGALAQAFAAPAANLLPLPPGLADREAVFAEPLAAALQPARQVHLATGTRLLVLGDGKLGLLCALGLRAWTPGLVLAGRHRDKLAIAAAQGVETALLEPGLSGPELAERLGRWEVVVEATGRPEGLEQALHLARPRGTVVAKTTLARPAPLDVARLVVEEITLVGSRCGEMGLALDFLARRRLRVEPLVEAVYPLEEAPAALEAAAAPGAKKVLVEVG